MRHQMELDSVLKDHDRHGLHRQLPGRPDPGTQRHPHSLSALGRNQADFASCRDMHLMDALDRQSDAVAIPRAIGPGRGTHALVRDVDPGNIAVSQEIPERRSHGVSRVLIHSLPASPIMAESTAPQYENATIYSTFVIYGGRIGALSGGFLSQMPHACPALVGKTRRFGHLLRGGRVLSVDSSGRGVAILRPHRDAISLRDHR